MLFVHGTTQAHSNGHRSVLRACCDTSLAPTRPTVATIDNRSHA